MYKREPVKNSTRSVFYTSGQEAEGHAHRSYLNQSDHVRYTGYR